MEPVVLTALIGAGGTVVGAAGVGPVIAHLLGRKVRAVQAALTQSQAALAQAQAKQQEAQAEQLRADADRIRQDIYQEITADLRAELQQAKAALHDVRQSLAATSAEAEQLRRRVVELESRIAHLANVEQRQAAELRAVQTERDQLRVQLAGKEATITALTAQLGDLKVQLAGLTTPAPHPTHT